MTYFQAAMAVLEYTERPLTVGELTAVAIAEGLISPRGRTPDRSMSSVLYRRMVTDPAAPVISESGRFWLRGRGTPEQTRGFYGSGIRHVRRHSSVERQVRTAPASRTPSALPAPPFALPFSISAPSRLESSGGRHERAIERLEASLRMRRSRVARYADATDGWDIDQTHARAVAPLLTLLGYRRVDQRVASTTSRRRAAMLTAGGEPVIWLESFRYAHALADADAWPTIERARMADLAWVLLTNGHELRLYSVALASTVAGPAQALVLQVDASDLDLDDQPMSTARLLALLTRNAVGSGSLDAYLVARAVGSALLSAADDPDSALLRALGEAVRAATGLNVPLPTLARQARLAVRCARGRDGAPMPTDTVSVALAQGTARVLAMPTAGQSIALTG